MAKLLFLAGSSRKDSLNKKLAQNAAHIAKTLCGADVTFIDLKDYPMPIYDYDIQEEGFPENALKLKKLFIEHDGFFISSPEYNGSIPPLLKNALDWISRKEEDSEKAYLAFAGKTAAISAASPGAMGGIRVLVPLRMWLNNMSVLVIPEQLAAGGADKSFDTYGEMINEQQKSHLVNVVMRFVKVANAYKNL